MFGVSGALPVQVSRGKSFAHDRKIKFSDTCVGTLIMWRPPLLRTILECVGAGPRPAAAWQYEMVPARKTIIRD